VQWVGPAGWMGESGWHRDLPDLEERMLSRHEVVAGPANVRLWAVASP